MASAGYAALNSSNQFAVTATTSKPIPAHDPIRATMALISVSLPGRYSVNRLEDVLPASASMGTGVAYPQENAYSGHGLTRLVCGDSYVFDSCAASSTASSSNSNGDVGGGLSRKLDMSLGRLIPLSRSTLSSPLATTLSSLWGVEDASDRLVFALPFAVSRHKETAPKSSSPSMLYSSPLSVAAFAAMVRDGQCKLHFLAPAEQVHLDRTNARRLAQQTPATSTSTSSSSRGPVLGTCASAPGSYSLQEAIVGARLRAPSPRALDGLQVTLTHRRPSKVQQSQQPSRIDRSIERDSPVPLPASSLVSSSSVSSSVSRGLWNRNVTCQRAHQSLAVTAAFFSSFNPQRPLSSVFLERNVEITPSVPQAAAAAPAAAATPSTPSSPIELTLEERGIFKSSDQVMQKLFAQHDQRKQQKQQETATAAATAAAATSSTDSDFLLGSSIAASSSSSSASSETAFVTVETMVKGTNFGELAAPVVKGVITPLTEIVGTALIAVTEFFMGKELPSILDIGLNDLVSRELTGSVAEPLLQIYPFSIAEIMNDQLPPLIAHQVAEDVVKDITPRINRIVTRRLHRVISRTLAQNVERPARRMMNNNLGSDLAHILSLSLPATITPALLYTLTHNPQQDYFCYYCNKKELYCIYCHQNRATVARQNYYAEFYTGFYSRYYTAYYRNFFVQLEDAKEEEAIMREHQVHFDQSWKQTGRLVLEEILLKREPNQVFPRQTPPPPGVIEIGPEGGVVAGYESAAESKYE